MQNNKLMMIVIIVLLVVLIGAIAAVGYFVVLKPKDAEDPAANQVAQSAVTLSMDQITLVDLGETRTNLLTGSDGVDHAISISFVVGINNSDKKNSEAFISTFNTNIKIAQATALSVVKSKTFQEMKRPDASTIVEGEVLTKLQEKFNSNLIVSVDTYGTYVQ